VFGPGVNVQEVPSHDSNSVWVAVPVRVPTATQPVGEVHETDVRLAFASAGPGVVDHAAPSHVSINGCTVVAPPPPTATQYVGAVQEMPLILLPAGNEVGERDQDVPSHISMRAWEPLDSKYPPTATQNEGDAHDTCWRPTARADGVGLGVMDQEVPSQVSINV